jgi:three-Cys-motif partner protein
MSIPHRFGGSWTEEKLDRVRQYLTAYTTIFTKNPRAATLRTIYVDAFAGTGYRTSSSARGSSPSLPLFEDDDAVSFQKGSAHIALETEPPFDPYLFIEQVAERIEELQSLRQQFPHRAQQITILHENANSFLRQWCRDTDWHIHRAVVFLDPYGMEVSWSTIDAIAQTHAIDLWLLFPLGQAVNRLLTRHHPPIAVWAQRLTQMFGTEGWKDAFYRAPMQGTLFGAETALEKDADFDAIGAFFVQRLETVFAQVVKKPLPLRNTKNVPIYLLCFAAGNPTGAPTAVRIASHILRR